MKTRQLTEFEGLVLIAIGKIAEADERRVGKIEEEITSLRGHGACFSKIRKALTSLASQGYVSKDVSVGTRFRFRTYQLTASANEILAEAGLS